MNYSTILVFIYLLVLPTGLKAEPGFGSSTHPMRERKQASTFTSPAAAIQAISAAYYALPITPEINKNRIAGINYIKANKAETTETLLNLINQLDLANTKRLLVYYDILAEIPSDTAINFIKTKALESVDTNSLEAAEIQTQAIHTALSTLGKIGKKASRIESIPVRDKAREALFEIVRTQPLNTNAARGAIAQIEQVMPGRRAYLKIDQLLNEQALQINLKKNTRSKAFP